MTSSTTPAFMAKKQSTSFTQVANNLLTVLQGYSKTIRLLLVMFVTLTVSAEVWGAEYETPFTITSDAVVNGSGYTKYTHTDASSREWIITHGGNNKSVGTNSSNRNSCKLTNYSKYAVSPVTTSSIASAFVSTTSLTDIGKISYTFNGGKNQTSTEVYLIYSSDNNTFSQISLSTGTQGATISSGTSYTFAKKTGYFGLLFVATNSSGDWRIDDVNISFYKEKESTPTHTVTATSNNNNYGTVSVSGTTITASPKTGYRVSTTNPYSISPSGSATVAQNGNTFNVTPSANTTITINFEAIPTHKVYFNTSGLVDIESVDVQEGQTYNITQTPASSLTQECEYNTFVGWTKSNKIANPSSKPTIVNSIEMESSYITLYAVYSKTEGGGGSAAEQGTTMFSENWEGCTNNTQPAQPTTSGSAVYNAADIDYVWYTPSGGSKTQTYTSGGPNSNENILISKNNGYWKVVGIPTGQAETLTLSFSKSGSGVLSVSTSTSNVSISGSTITIGSSSVNTFDLIFTNTKSGDNLRLDDISVVVAKAGATGSTTYSLTPECTAKPSYSVTFNANGHGTAPDTQTVESGHKATEPTAPTATGYTFGGWYKESGCMNKFDFNTPITDDIPLFAKWTPITYTVSFDNNGGTGTMANQTFTYNQAQTLTANTFTRTDYTFNGWNTKSDGSGDSYANSQSVKNLASTNGATITLYAQWKIQTFTVTFNSNGGTGTMANQTFTYNQAQTLTANTFTRTGYTFNGWNTQANGQGTTYTDQQSVTLTTAGLTLYAQWKANTYTVAFNANGGTGSMSNQSFTYDQSQSLTANAFTRTNYAFKNWNTKADGSGTNYTDKQSVSNLTTTNDETVTLYAQWSELYTVTFYNMGSVYTTKTQESVGGSITIQETPSACEGYTFDGWSATEVDGVTSYEAVTTITPNKDTPLYAVYSKSEDGGGNATVEDELTYTGIGLGIASSGTATYTDFSNVEVTSKAIYAGQINKFVNNNDPNDVIQLRAKNSNSGIVTTTSGGKAKKVTVVWHSNTTSGRILNVYGKNSAYSAASDLYNNSNQGDLLGTIVYGTSTELTISGDYEYIGLRSFESAMYFTSITITWATGGSSTTYTTDPSCVPTYSLTNIISPSAEYGNISPETVEGIPENTSISTSNNTYTVNGTTVTAIPAAATAQYTYAFSSWSNLPATVTADATVTANFTRTINKYTITWKNGDNILETDSDVEYGATPTYDGDKPTKEQDEIYTYEFTGWTPEIADVTGDQIYTATYNQIKRQYTVIWFVNGMQVHTEQVDAGNEITPPTVNPIPCGAVLAGWTDAENGVYEHGTSTLHEGAKPSIEVTENKTFYAVFADSEGTTPEMPTVIAYWSAKEITTSEMKADEGLGSMESNIALSTESSTGKSYYKNLGQNGTTKPVITLSNLNLTTSSHVCFSFWARGSEQGNLTVKTNLSDEAIATFKLTTKEALYVLENIPTTATSIVITYEEMTGTFFFGTVKFYEAPEIYSFEKLTAENTNGWTGSDWDGYYLITDADTKALDGNAIGEYSNQRVEEVDNKIECSITTAFHIIYNSEKNGYSVQGVGDGDYLQRGNNTITVSSTAVYLPAISYNSLKGGDNYELQWNGDKCAFYASTQSAPQMYKIMSELSNHRTLCTYNIEYTNLEGATHTNPNTYTAADLPLTFTAPSAREGYTFKGWEPATLGTETRGDQVVEAQWTVNQCVVTWKVNAQEVAKTTVDIANPLTTIPYTPADDALGCCAEKFIGWSTETNPTKSQVYTTASELQNLIGTLAANTTKTFHAVFATPVPGAGTSLVTFSEMGYANEEAVTSVTLGDGLGNGDATITFDKGTAATYRPTYYTIGEAVRTYVGNTITVDATYASTTLTQIDLTFAKGEYANTITASTGTITDGVWTGNAQSVTFTIGGTTGHRRIASIAVTTEVTGDKYTNYVTKCDLSNSASIGAGTITYTNSATAIDTKCGQRSPASKAATLTFASAQNLTCPVTIEATTGFLVSTNRNDNSKYASSIIVKPVKSGTNKGTLPTIYVRYEANFGATGQIHGTITATGSEIDNTDVAVLANVTCTQYTLTVVDHLGNTISTTNYYEGNEVAEIAQPTPDDCSKNYIFVGWSESAVEYGSLVYNQVTFPYTMPAKDVILYPVYQCNKTADYHRVTSDLGLGDVDGNNWAGDYLIAASSQIFANGSTGGTDDVNCIGGVGSAVNPEDNLIDDLVKYAWGDVFNVTLVKVDGGYVLQTGDKKYNYLTNGATSAGLSVNEDIKYASINNNPLTVTFNNEKDIVITNPVNTNGFALKYSSQTSSFRFLKSGTSIYLYKKSPLYTSYLACGTISVSEEEVYVTATKQRGIMANQPLTVTANNMYPNAQVIVTSNNADVYFSAKRDANFAMAAANQPQQSLTLTANETGALSQSIYIHYRPSSEGDGVPADVEVTAQSHNLPISDNHTIHVRNLPAKFVLATKVGAVWYALPANMTEPTNPSGVVIEVDETNMTAIAPNTTVYTLFPVATVNGDSDRYKEYGERLRFAAVNNGNRGLWANDAKSGTTINNDAAITAANSTAGAAYEWKITTTIVDGNWQYTLQTDQSNNQKYLRYWTAASGGAKWGTYAYGNDKLYFLPVTETKPFDYKVVEWYPTKVLIQIDAAITNPIVKIGGILVDNVTCTNKGGKLYEISGLSLAENPTKVLTLSYTADEVTYTNSKVVPIILSRETKSISGEPFVALTKEVYNYADLVVRDGATLTMDGTQEANTLWDVTIYPTSKISVPESKKLTVHSLTLFGGIDEIYNGSTYTTNKYGVPQLSLKGTLGKTVTTMDYIMRVNLDQMYQVGVPYDVNLNEITYWDGTSIELGTALYISAYDGAARARLDWDNTWQWEVNFAEKVLKAGIGYTISAEPQVAGDTYSILRMPMKNNINSGNTETQKATINVTAHGMSDENLTDNHKGWNYLSNPYMTSISGAESGGVDNNNIVVGYLVETGKGPWEWKNDTYRYVTIPYDDGTNYYQRKFSEATLLPFKSFFLQIANSGDLSFALASRLNAPMRHLQQQENAPREVEFELLLSNDAQSDNTGLLISEEFTPAYEINADLEKMTGTMSVYTIYNGYHLAYNALSPLNAMEEIPLGYVVPTTGEYTFNLDERGDLDDIEHIYLLDHDSSITTDLMEDIYTFTATEKKNDHRFAISVILKAEEEEETPTHLETLEWESDHPYKFIYQDKMYILRNGVIYDAMGKQVQTINK